MDIEDTLDELWSERMGAVRDRAGQARHQLRRRSHLPGLRRRVRMAALWGSGAWLTTWGGLGVASEVAVDGGIGTIFAVVCAGIALPAVPTGIWAWRTRPRDRDEAREAGAKKLARQERDDLPVDVITDWTRLRRAQALVEDLAGEALVDVEAIGEQAALVANLRQLLAADRRASDLGAPKSQPLREQVRDLGDLLVALAAEAVEQRTEEVGASHAPATLRDARERLAALRSARSELTAVEDRAAEANALIDRVRASRDDLTPGSDRPRQTRRRGTEPSDTTDDDPGTPMATPG